MPSANSTPNHLHIHRAMKTLYRDHDNVMRTIGLDASSRPLGYSLRQLRLLPDAKTGEPAIFGSKGATLEALQDAKKKGQSR